MNDLRPFFLPRLGKAKGSVRRLFGFCAMAIAVTVVVDASAEAKGGPRDPKGQSERKGPLAAERSGHKGEHGRGGPDGKTDVDHEKMGHRHGAAGAPGMGEPRHDGDFRALGKRLKELREKEAVGKLTADEKAELAKLRHHPGRHWGILRKGLIEELEAKEKSGKLTDEEKADLEKARKIQARHEGLKQSFADAARKRKERARDAKRQALSEFPNLHENQAAVAEYKKHAERLAKLERAKELASADESADMVLKIDRLITAEKQRHQAWLSKNQPKAQGATQ